MRQLSSVSRLHGGLRASRIATALGVGSLLVACSSGATDGRTTAAGATGQPSIARRGAALLPGNQSPVAIRADANRDGVIDFADSTDANGISWDPSSGAIFLANIDDDGKRCVYDPSTSDADLAACNDASDLIVNGPADLLDLARIKTAPWGAVPAGATGSLSVSDPASGYVHLFLNGVGAGATDTDFTLFDPATSAITTAGVQSGVEFGIEATDFVRDRAVWDGYADVTYTVTDADGVTVLGSDTVRLRVAPIMTSHHLSTATQAIVASSGRPDGVAFSNAIKTAATAAGIPGTTAVIGDNDQWAQDYIETGWASMPKPGGGQQSMILVIRSANQQRNTLGGYTLRPAGRWAYRFAGPDVAGITQFKADLTLAERRMDSLNSYGNLETIPPYTLAGVSYPLGRVFRGSTTAWHPDSSFNTMMEAQLVQPPVYIDTEWLLVGHVDETTSFVKASTPRGWKLVIGDARLGKQLLQDQADAGLGDTAMFVGKKWYERGIGEFAADTTIQKVLDDTAIMTATQRDAVKVDAQVAILKTATGITDADIVRVPAIDKAVSGFNVAYVPGIVNVLYLSDTQVAAPDPHGPVIGGVDIFKDATEKAYSPLGITVVWIEDWDLYHRLDGEVHCGTNTVRALPTVKWWETGR